MVILLLVVVALASYFVWTTFHELSHLLAAKMLVGADLVEMRLYPHIDKDKGFRWGSVSFKLHQSPTPMQALCISMAPRVPDILALAMLPLAGFFTGDPALIWSVFWAAGVVDLVVGSIGHSEHSDLKVSAALIDVSPWVFRASGFFLAAASVVGWLLTRYWC